MKNFTIYELATGRVLYTGQCGDSEVELQVVPPGAGIVEVFAPFERYYITPQGSVAAFPSQPSDYHVWDWATKSWIVPQEAIDIAKANKKAEVEQLRAFHEYKQVSFEGNLYDGDEVSQNNVISWTTLVAAGVPLPPGFTWRDATNVERAADFLFLKGLSSIFITKKSKVYRNQWAHKAAIDALTSIPAISLYSILTGWD